MFCFLVATIISPSVQLLSASSVSLEAGLLFWTPSQSLRLGLRRFSQGFRGPTMWSLSPLEGLRLGVL